MKGRFKDRAKQITLIVLFLVISVLTISLIAGRINTVEILVVKKEGLNTEKTLDNQLEYFEKKEILKSEMKYFKGTVVTSKQQLKNKVLLYNLKPGSPIPLSSLEEPNGAGQFAAIMPKGRTVHLLSQAMVGLPPVQAGDKINIALSYKEKDDDGTEKIHTGMLMTDIKIYRIVENNIYVDVDLEQDLVLSTASQLGTFVYQIPGQKTGLCGNDSTDCSSDDTDSTPAVIEQSDIFKAILNKTYSTTTSSVDKAINGSPKDEKNNDEAEKASSTVITNSSSSKSNSDESSGGDKK
ncbi:hypothetical protein AAGG74_18560 [Bacillus mexicanus]|uniref:hypothetical protein n=1 Tax=Bacillus mexicanus TaxID=2834415 RepID=UPI003D20D45F